MCRKRFVPLPAVIFLAACLDTPVAPAPPSAHLLTAVWPGDSVLVVSPGVATLPAERVWVTAGDDTLAFVIVNDSTLAVPIPSTAPSGDLTLTIHTPRGAMTAGTFHVYGFVGYSTIDGQYTQMTLPFTIAAPNAQTLVAWDSVRGAIALLDPVGDVSSPMWFGEFPADTACASAGFLGLGPSYRAADGWIASCRGLRKLTSPVASVPFASPVPAELVAEIGPATLLLADARHAWTSHVHADGSLTSFGNPVSVRLVQGIALSPDGTRAIILTAGAESDSAAPGVPVFDATGAVAYHLFDRSVPELSATFSGTGDTLFVATDGRLYWFRAADGVPLDSIALPDSTAAPMPLYAPAGSAYLYGADPLNGLVVVNRGTPAIRAVLAGRCLGWHGAVVAAPAAHTLFVVGGSDAPITDADHGPLPVCRFDVP